MCVDDGPKGDMHVGDGWGERRVRVFLGRGEAKSSALLAFTQTAEINFQDENSSGWQPNLSTPTRSPGD